MQPIVSLSRATLDTLGQRVAVPRYGRPPSSRRKPRMRARGSRAAQ
jgi:hypothetical protein